MNTIAKTLLIPLILCVLFAGGYLLRMLYVWPPGKEGWIEQCFVMLIFHVLCVIVLLPVVIWSVVRVWSKVRCSGRIALLFFALALLAATVIVPELALKRMDRIRPNRVRKSSVVVQQAEKVDQTEKSEQVTGNMEGQ
jgi:uncharacterized membrane protein